MFNRGKLPVLLIALFLIAVPVTSCGPKYKAAKAQKEHERRMELRREEGEKALQRGKERHWEIQTKETRERMKETRRQSQRLNNIRKEPFYIRWYRAIIRR